MLLTTVAGWRFLSLFIFVLFFSLLVRTERDSKGLERASSRKGSVKMRWHVFFVCICGMEAYLYQEMGKGKVGNCQLGGLTLWIYGGYILLFYGLSESLDDDDDEMMK